MKYRFAAETDVGRVRRNNEDSLIADPDRGLFVVADGMGGHAAGEVASGMAVGQVAGYVERYADIQSDRAKLLAQAIKKANEAIYRNSLTEERLLGMGTTVTAVMIENGRLYWAHVGDSRLYCVDGREIRQISADHTLVAQMVADGRISLEDARVHHRRNVLVNAVGVDNVVEVDTGSEQLAAGQCWLICSDGLSDMLDDREIADLVRQWQNDPAGLCRQLVSEANRRGGVDNITVVAIVAGDGVGQ
ncbi:MAG: Stp1/IreP family PP2C-type Ser/Thr phosphatase [Negativicutes bacterium]|nr:Stp1/IreP family PP2C-type Ser/Thr phosphatase [Negativicutes bacterium]